MNPTFRRFIQSLSGGLPTILTLIAFGAVAYIGHRTNWKMPSSSKVFSQQAAVKDDWCGDHGVPESTCMQCKGIAADPTNLPSQHKPGNVMLAQASGDAKPYAEGASPASAPAPVPVDWCGGHGVPESVCTRCNADLIPAFKAKGDWCKEHDLPNSQCVKCNPELKAEFEAMDPRKKPAPTTAPATTQAAVDWCKEHGVPESVCTRCNPDLIPAFKAKSDWCNGHSVPESQCVQCNPELKEKFEKMAPKAQANADRVIQLTSADVAGKAGIVAQPAQSRPLTQHIETNAELRYDMTRYAQVSPRVAGNVGLVRVQAGQRVKRGDVLALIESADVGKAKAEYLTAAAMVAAKQASLERVKNSTDQGFRNKSDLIAADAESREASIRLFNARQSLVNLGLVVPNLKTGEVPEEHSVQLLGLPESIRADLDPERASANLIPVVAPLDGVVVSRSVVEGEMIETGKPMFVVADNSRMWIKLDVPMSELSRMKIGQDISFSADGLEKPAAGKITWISTEVDDKTRTVEVRGEVPNTDGHLLANIFGRAKVSVAEKAQATVVPASAVQWDGTHHLVFVKVNDEVYVARTVEIGIRDGDLVEVTNLRPADPVAVGGSYSLLAQLNRGKLGAGCVDD
jgi:cobalt-zinc-cadmium efflux system membrane fusion protein